MPQVIIGSECVNPLVYWHRWWTAVWRESSRIYVEVNFHHMVLYAGIDVFTSYEDITEIVLQATFHLKDKGEKFLSWE